MRVGVSGATGLVGSALRPVLKGRGHQTVRLVRRPAQGDDEVSFHLSRGIDPGALEGIDALVHLAGENIASGRWTQARKRRIRDSRVVGTRSLAESVAGMDTPPTVLVCASAIGFYGDRGDEILRENSPPGKNFLAEVCQEWERAADPAREAGIRVVHLRFGIILSARGGALPRMVLPFRMGLGGKIGSGSQYMSWITLDDTVGCILHALETDAVRGPANTVTPSPVTNLEFTRTLGRVLSRPTLFPLPTLGAKLVFGEMGEELLLGSARVEPHILPDTGYRFRHPDLEAALRHVLGRPARRAA